MTESVAESAGRAAGRMPAFALPRRPRRLGLVARQVWLGCVVLFIYAPILVVIGASFDPGSFIQNRAFLHFPPRGFTLHWYVAIEPSLWASVWSSVKLASGVAAGAVLVGVPAALGLVRANFPGRSLVASLFRVPLQIPFIVTGVAFLQSYYALSAATGLSLQQSFAGLFIAHLFLAVPYVLGAVGASLTQLSPSFEDAALSLGASRWRAFRRVTLPIIMPGIFGGALFAFLVSFTDVTVAVFLAPQNQTTFPVWVFSSVQNDLEPSIPALSTLVFLASAALLVGLQKLLGIETLLRSGGAKG